MGSLFDDVARPDHHSDGPAPLAHHPLTSGSVRGPVRGPRGLRRSRREEALPPWEAAVATHVPALESPPHTQARHRLQTQVAPVVRQAPDVQARHEPCRTHRALAIAPGKRPSGRT